MVAGLVVAALVVGYLGLISWEVSVARAIVLAVVAAILWTSAFWVWLFTPGSTRRELVRVGWFRRWIRWNRSLWLRAASTIAGWPHVIVAMMGAGRVEVGQTVGQIVWNDGRATLKRYESARTGEVVLVVHALVTRPWILDLAPNVSLVKALVDQGHDVYLLDWGDAGRSDAERGLGEYIATLMRAEQEVARRSGGPRIHMIGYCMGATLCLARLASHEHDNVASFAAIAAPVDFAVPGGMQRSMSHRMLKPALLLDQTGCVPASVVRGSFHMLKPEALKAIRRARDAKKDPESWQIYAALSRWVWEHRPLPGALFFDLVELYRSNSLFRGEFTVGGGKVRLGAVSCPVMIAVAERDHIVPGSSSHALATVLDVETLPCPSGHVSLLSGRGARSVLIPGLLSWIATNAAVGAPHGREAAVEAPEPAPKKRAPRRSPAKTATKAGRKPARKTSPPRSRVASKARGR